MDRSDALEGVLRRTLDDPGAVASLVAELDARESEGPAGLGPPVEHDDRASGVSQRDDKRSILESLLCAGSVCDRSGSDAIITALRCLISEGVSDPEVGGDLDALVLGLIRRIDATLSAQVAEALHDPKFQRLESTWRGLHYLVTGSETSESLKIRVANVRRVELLRDFKRAVE